MQKPEYFTKFPNDYIQGDIRSKYGVSRKFYITYILIDRYRSYEDYSWITIRKVMEFYGYKTTKHKPKVFHEILDVLEYMINNHMIEIKQNLDSIGYDTGIEIKVIPENFDVADKFSKITSSQLDFIMMAESSINKENLLMAFLYINSYIYIRPRNNRNQEIMKNPSSKPEAFWESVDSMSKELSMSKDTINQCMTCFTSTVADKQPILIKINAEDVKAYVGKIPQNIPNVYVLNKKGYEQEVKMGDPKNATNLQHSSISKCRWRINKCNPSITANQKEWCYEI